ncbi:MAG TPA: superoxide dismutase [Bacteroidales bacterium]|nr:superoxide dismutase [Bacteroidales bacterium]HPF01635.1 superoxide dismutase [Bacteroidales bacterium]HPR13309.1 superoxide dismutase [Bacteroidales bacterium]HRW85620.1 superoxide dismutase [Bacteroidales bacterium]
MKSINFVKTIALVSILSFTALTTMCGQTTNSKTNTMENLSLTEFPALPYAYDALEPYIDARTMEIHYDRHHRAYFNNFVAAIKGTVYENMPVGKTFAEISKAGDAIRNNGGGYYNHVLYWKIMGKGSSGPSTELSAAIDKAFGSFDKFKETFSTAAKTRFGSGWAWLVLTPEKTLAVGSTPNQDNPLMDVSPLKGTPILNIDVWEHAYYLKYQNKRPDYIEAFWNVINWDEVNRLYREAVK